MNKIGSYNSSTLYAQSQNASKLDEEVEQYKQENNFTQTDMYSVNLEESAKAENAIVLVISIFLYGFITVITLIGITNKYELKKKRICHVKINRNDKKRI